MKELLESVPLQTSGIDHENCVIRGAKILGRDSAHGYEYTERAMQEASKCYEGISLNVDHQRDGKERPLAARIGWVTESEYRDGAVYGTLNLLKSHPMTPSIVEMAERNPLLFGLSHVAKTPDIKPVRAGKPKVESVWSVSSVDLVQKPATNKGLFESEEPVSKTKTLREFVDGIADHPEKSKLLKLMESDPALGNAMMTGEPDGDEGGTDGAVKAAFEAAIVAAFRDDSLDMKATLAKIKAVLKAYDGLSGATEAPTETPEKTMESVEEENRQLKAREGARVLLESAGVAVNTNRIGLLAGLNDEAGRKSLVDDWKKLDAGAVQKPRPRSGSILRESQGGGKTYEELTAGGFAKAAR